MVSSWDYKLVCVWSYFLVCLCTHWDALSESSNACAIKCVHKHVHTHIKAWEYKVLLSCIHISIVSQKMYSGTMLLWRLIFLS